MSHPPSNTTDSLHVSNTQSNEAASSTPPAVVLANIDPWSLKTVLASLPFPPPKNPTSTLPFLHLIERLKTTKREGWRRFGISAGESISDHMYRMSIITMLAPPSLSSRLSLSRCMKMALVHDMAEALVGDITPVDGVPVAEKHSRESETMDFLTGTLLGRSSGGFEQGQGIREVWQEYEDSQTLEAVFVHDVDKIELVLQMMEYERSHEGRLDLGEFTGVVKRIRLPEVKAWCTELLREREEFWGQLGRQASGLGGGGA